MPCSVLCAPGMYAVHLHTLRQNTKNREADAGRSLSLRRAWYTKQVPGQPGLHEEILSKKTQKNKKTFK